MRGVVLKSHWWPTVHAVHYLAQLYRGPVAVWSSITLNPVAGGPELWAVESAARLGARMVFLPTWGAAADLRAAGMSARLQGVFPSFDPRHIAGASFLDGDGELTEQGRALLEFCAANDLTLATGHVSWQESLAFAQEARRRDYRRLVFSHPLSSSVRAPLDAAQRTAALGAWVELCWTAVAPGRLTAAEAVSWIRQVGIEHVVLSTDRFRPESPNPPELFAELLGMLHDAGLGAAELQRMAAENPARALGV